MLVGIVGILQRRLVGRLADRSIPIQPATLCPHPMPTGLWTVPTPLTAPELATTTIANPYPATTTTRYHPFSSGSSGTLALLLWPLPTRVDPYAIYIAASIKLIEISAHRSLAVDVTVVKRGSVRSSRVSRGHIVSFAFFSGVRDISPGDSWRRIR